MTLQEEIFKAIEQAKKENMKANVVMIDNEIGRTILSGKIGGSIYYTPMIFGLKIALTDELPSDFAFAIAEAKKPPQTRLEYLEKENKELKERLQSLIEKIEFAIGDTYDD